MPSSPVVKSASTVPVFFGGEVSFEHAKFSGGQVSFERPEFSGGQVRFADTLIRENPPVFGGDGKPPAGVVWVPARQGILAYPAGYPRPQNACR